MSDRDWTLKELIEVLRRFTPDAKVYYETLPNSPADLWDGLCSGQTGTQTK